MDCCNSSEKRKSCTVVYPNELYLLIKYGKYLTNYGKIILYLFLIPTPMSLHMTDGWEKYDIRKAFT